MDEFDKILRMNVNASGDEKKKLEECARNIYALYENLMGAGFNEGQAMHLLSVILNGASAIGKQ